MRAVVALLFIVGAVWADTLDIYKRSILPEAEICKKQVGASDDDLKTLMKLEKGSWSQKAKRSRFCESMKVTCTVCHDVLVAAETFGTNCGHLFHHKCLIRWLQRFKSCPQCRAKSDEKDVCRIHFNIPPPNAGTGVPNTLENKFDSLELNMMSKNIELRKCKKAIAAFKKKATEQKNEIKRLKEDDKLAKRKECILKQQSKILRLRNVTLESVRKECERLQEETQLLRKSLMGLGIENVIEGTSAELHGILEFYGEYSAARRSLLLFTTVLKKGIKTIAVKNTELGIKLREAQSEVFSLTAQIRSLEESIKSMEEEKNLLEEISTAAQQ